MKKGVKEKKKVKAENIRVEYWRGWGRKSILAFLSSPVPHSQLTDSIYNIYIYICDSVYYFVEFVEGKKKIMYRNET